MKDFDKFIKAAVNKLEAARKEAEKEVTDDNLEAILIYFGQNAGLEKVLYSSGVDSDTLSVDTTNGLLCILAEANNQWDSVQVDEDGPTQEQDKILDDILMTTACDIICYLNDEHVSRIF